MDINIDIINNNLKECWEYYKEYLERYKKENYSNSKPEDFISWCEDELIYCNNCGDIYLKYEQNHLNEPYNPDNVCDYCIEENGYYD